MWRSLLSAQDFLCAGLRWRVGNGYKGNPQRSDECPFRDQKETQHHMFLECSWSSRIWRGSPWESAFTVHGSSDCMKWVAEVMKHESLDVAESWAMVLSAIWKEQYAHLFNGPKWPEDEIL
ncbi:unnamed protein product [Linum trigynum]|uniref:Reverse transcriptase zinc-binding domain-containing protein n=1 Tax=Linum trigynum TaxID=586398 RepID=A0AAV2EC67_9ROSI